MILNAFGQMVSIHLRHFDVCNHYIYIVYEVVAFYIGSVFQVVPCIGSVGKETQLFIASLNQQIFNI